METENLIICDCTDPSCLQEGLEGEVGGHIRTCSCSDCHQIMGKL